jgi:hypothetical protein
MPATGNGRRDIKDICSGHDPRDVSDVPLRGKIMAVGSAAGKSALRLVSESTPKDVSKLEAKWAGRVPLVRPGRYADGLPFHEINYLACKLILRPNRFTSRQSLFDFAKVLRGPAEQCGVQLITKEFRDVPLRIREVLFVDTEDFRLYNNAFILRRRIPYTDGFPSGEPEMVFKFRHPDIQKAAETDVRPQIVGDHRVKFKCQALPLKDRLGGIRMLYSHSVQFPRSHAGNVGDVSHFAAIAKVFPVLDRLKQSPDEKIALVNNTIIEEVLQDVAALDFGSGLRAKTNVAIWRTRGEHRPLIGEFAFQMRFQDRKQFTLDALQRAERFFLVLQSAAADWISLNATKTGVVYRLLGNAPTAHE